MVGIVMTLVGCGSGAPNHDFQKDPRIRAALANLQSVLQAAAQPIAARPGFKVSAGAEQLHGLDLWHAVVDPMIAPLTRVDGTAATRAALNPQQYVVFALFMVDADIENGGFWQLYFNSSGAFANEAVDLLSVVGAPRHGAVVARANRITWPSGDVPALRAARQRALPGINSHRYAAVDAAWTRADEAEGTLADLVDRYIRAHPSAFFEHP